MLSGVGTGYTSEPWRALMLLRQRQSRADAPVGAEKLSEKLRAITLLTAMQQNDVIRQSTRAVEEFADSGQGLAVGKAAMPARYAALQEPRAGAVRLHLRVVVGFERYAVKIAKPVEEVWRYVPEVGGVTDAIAKAVNDEAMRTEVVVSELYRLASEPGDRQECISVELSCKRREFGTAGSKGADLVGVTIDWDIEAAESRSPMGRKVVAIEVGQAERDNVRR